MDHDLVEDNKKARAVLPFRCKRRGVEMLLEQYAPSDLVAVVIFTDMTAYIDVVVAGGIGVSAG